MLGLDLAIQLKSSGLEWTPTPGDRFVVPVDDMQDEVFILSNVIADVHEFDSGAVIGFNGTTEWALDSISQADVVWLPREDQLRELLGESFVTLEQVPGGYAVSLAPEGRYIDIDAERAYARAVLARRTASTT